MTNGYHVDTSQLSLERFRAMLERGYLLPSEAILGEAMPERFAVLQSMGIETVKDLTTALSTKKKLQGFAQESGLPEPYLVVLRRRAGTFTPRPAPLVKMPGVDAGVVERLAGLGIKDSRQLFARARTRGQRAELEVLADVPPDALLELVNLSDLVRAPYVGPVYARLFYEAGLDTLEKMGACPPEELVVRMHAVNEEKQITKAAVPTSAAEMASFLEIVELVPKAVEY